MKCIKRFIVFALFGFIIVGCKSHGFIVATWNIGHFANGASSNSLIKGDNYDEKLELYRNFINDLDADIFCLNEYSKLFGVDSRGVEKETKEVLLNNYNTIIEGDQVGFSCNAIFGNYNVTNIERHEFKCTIDYVKELPRVANYYYISGDLHYKRNVIKIVCAHTISRNNDLCQKMIAEIIDAYKDCDKVIMCGDWNTGNYKKFVKAGFSLGNDGSFMTYLQKPYPLDNIIVKGLNIKDVKVIETDLSDHRPLVCKISLK